MDIRSVWAARPEVPGKERRADKPLAALVANRSWSQCEEPSPPFDEKRLQLSSNAETSSVWTRRGPTEDPEPSVAQIS